MQTIENSATAHLPTSHIQSLHSIENGYWWFQGRVHWAQQMIQRAWQQATAPINTCYIDLGCGTGGFARSLISSLAIPKAALVDRDPAVLSLAGQENSAEAYQIDFSQNFELPWTPNLVTCMDVIEHIELDTQFLEKISRQLAPEGLMLISVPATPGLYSEWDRRLGHFRRYTAQGLRQTINQANLKVLAMSYMWSFLMPAAPIRMLKGQRYHQNMEFETVPPLANTFLVQLSRLECALSQFVPMPFGTSLIALTTKL